MYLPSHFGFALSPSSIRPRMASRYEIVNLMGGAAQQGLNLRQAEIGVDQLSDSFCYWLGSNFGPLDLLLKGRKFLLEFLRLSMPFGIQIDEVIHPHFLSNYRFLDDLLEVTSSPASTSLGNRRSRSGLGWLATGLARQ